jgi:hypothetical protein
MRTAAKACIPAIATLLIPGIVGAQESPRPRVKRPCSGYHAAMRLERLDPARFPRGTLAVIGTALIGKPGRRVPGVEDQTHYVVLTEGDGAGRLIVEEILGEFVERVGVGRHTMSYAAVGHLPSGESFVTVSLRHRIMVRRRPDGKLEPAEIAGEGRRMVAQ